jgi:MFS transporter, CP family, cyanate transporter
MKRDSTSAAAVEVGAGATGPLEQGISSRGSSSGRKTILLGLVILLIGFNMRPAIVALSPLLEDIRSATGMSHAMAGFLITLPLICFGIFAPLAPMVAKRFGMEHVLMSVLILLAVGTAVRLLSPLFMLFAGTMLIGTAVAVANVVVTIAIKRDFGHRVGLLSGLHTTMLVGGAALAAGLTGPVRDELDLTWRQGISIWGALTVIAIVAWIPFARRRDSGTTIASAFDAPSVWTSRLGWAVTLFYAFQSLVYYTTTAWIPTLYIAHGYSESAAGWLLAVVFICAIVSSVASPLIAEKVARQSFLVIVGSALCMVSIVALIANPSFLPLLSMMLLGLGLGAVLSLGITFMSMRARDHGSAGRLSAMAQCVGYLVAAIGPALFGAATDVSGTWTVGLVAVLVAMVPMAMSGYIAGRGGSI